MDIGTVTASLSALKTIKDLGVSLLGAKIDAEAKKQVAEVLEKLGDVQDTLYAMREEQIKLQDENQKLRIAIKELEERLETIGKVVYEKPSYWIRDGETNDGPFCQRCYDAEQKLVRLQDRHGDIWVCYDCKSTFYGPNYKPPEPPPRRGRSWAIR